MKKYIFNVRNIIFNWVKCFQLTHLSSTTPMVLLNIEVGHCLCSRYKQYLVNRPFKKHSSVSH